MSFCLLLSLATPIWSTQVEEGTELLAMHLREILSTSKPCHSDLVRLVHVANGQGLAGLLPSHTLLQVCVCLGCFVCVCVCVCVYAGGARKHYFRMARVKSIKNIYSNPVVES